MGGGRVGLYPNYEIPEYNEQNPFWQELPEHTPFDP